MVVRYCKIILYTVNAAAWLMIIVMILLVVWYMGKIFLYDRFIIPTLSMEPTLTSGDYVIVDKTIFGPRLYRDFYFDKKGVTLQSIRLRGSRRLQINDIVVFNYPLHDDKISFVINHVYCKRVVALPGDSISIVNGIYHNNNCPNGVGFVAAQHLLALMPECEIDSAILRKKHCNPHYIWTIKNMPAMYVPRKGDVIPITPKEGYIYQHILEWETCVPIKVDWERNVVFAGKQRLRHHRFLHNYYFMAGDNVLNSSDSRYWGVVPEEYVIGVVKFVKH